MTKQIDSDIGPPKHEIENEYLTLENIPAQNADYNTLANFATTFDGYGVAGSFNKCANIAKSPRETSITDLRISLFFNWRSCRHTGNGPSLEFLQETIGKIPFL